MVEIGENMRPKIIEVPLTWLHHRWNEVLYGFTDGKYPRYRMVALLGEKNMGLDGLMELTGLLGKTNRAGFQREMAKKIHDSVGQLVLRNPRNSDRQGMSNFIRAVSEEEGLE